MGSVKKRGKGRKKNEGMVTRMSGGCEVMSKETNEGESNWTWPFFETFRIKAGWFFFFTLVHF